MTATTGSRRTFTGHADAMSAWPGPFWRDVAFAMAAGMRSPVGERIDAICVDCHDGTYRVEYAIGATPVGMRTYRVEDERRISELTFVVRKYERRHRGYGNVTAIHRQLLENLAGSGCVITAAIGADESAVWADHYDWDPVHTDTNARNVAAAVETVYAAARDQRVWDAADLPQRVQLLGGPLLSPAALRAPWEHLLASRSPRELRDGLDALQPNLGEVVFKRMSWHGRREVD